MKIIHTSDWHLGQTFYDYDRSPEQKDMLRQIVEVVRCEQPDAFVLSGDVFHTGNPAPRAVEMYNRALLEMHQACPSMTIVVTGGNHDSASRLVVNNDLWGYFRVKVVGHVSKNDDEGRTPNFDEHIVGVASREGTLIGYIAAVPHCYESNFPTTDPSLQRDERMKAYFRGLASAIGARNHESLPVVLMAHMAIDGCDFSGHDNIGGMETHNVSVFGDGFDYVALGHIHTPKDINEHVRYCGTPIPVNFGEKFEHSVTIVTLQSGSDPVLEFRKIKNLVPLHDFPKEPEPFASVLEKIKSYPDDELCYLRLLVKVDDTMTPLATTLVAEAVKGKKCRVCKIQPFVDEQQHKSVAKPTALTGQELKAKSPMDIAKMFFELKGIDFSDDVIDMIKEATVKADQIRKGDHHEA